MDNGAGSTHGCRRCEVSRGASFTYLGLRFETPNGSSGFVAANDGSGTVATKSVIIAGGTEQEHRGLWLEFSPEDAIALAQGIIDAVEHASGRGDITAHDGPPHGDGLTPPPGDLTTWYEDEDGSLCRGFVAQERVLVTESSQHCPCCHEVVVGIAGVQESCGCIDAGVSLAADSELTVNEARQLAVMLMDSAAALEALERPNSEDGGVNS